VLVAGGTLIPDTGSSREFGPRLTHAITRGDLLVTVTEQGTLESSNNTEIKCQVRGENNTIIWVIESGTEVQPGDELLRLDTLLIEEEISERTKFAHLSRSVAERSWADVEKAKLAISEYREGRYVSQLATLEKDLAIAESRLRTTRNMRDHAKMMFESDYVSELEVEEKEFAVAQADLAVKLVETQIKVLKRFTKEEELATLRGNLAADEAQHEADKERAYADEQRLKRAEKELQHCVVKAKRSGMVIYPSAEEWKEAPEIEEGATVHKDQVLLLMPDLSKMQVKVGIHESIVDRIRPGLAARVTLPEKALDGTVSSVSAVTRPAGWWTGNVVKYDTIIELPSVEGLKPGMSAEVEVIMARHENVLMIPAAAALETKKGYACWVETAAGTRRRTIELGDSSDMFIVVEAGLEEGDEVVLDPLASIEEAQTEAAKTLDEAKSHAPDLSEF
jgi:multidrug efflux pump subunit AcrA (membrane-fusion protein)